MRWARCSPFLVALAAALLGRALPAQSTTIGFDEPVELGAPFVPLGGEYTQDGYTLRCRSTIPGTDCTDLAILPAGSSGLGGVPVLSNVAFVNNTFAGQSVLTRGDGVPFRLLSIDLLPFSRVQTSVSFFGERLDGSLVTATSLGSLVDGFTTFTLPGTFQNLRSVLWRGEFVGSPGEDGAQEIQAVFYDNISLATDATAVVPEPATMLLTGLGLGALRICGRRRRASAGAAA